MTRLKLGEGQLLQAVKALPATLRAQAATAPESLAAPSAVRTQTAAIKNVGIPSDWHEDGRVKVDIGLPLSYADIQDPDRLSQAADALLYRLRLGNIEATPIPGSPAVEAQVPLAQLEWVAALPDTGQISLMNLPVATAFSAGATASNTAYLRELGNSENVAPDLKTRLRGDGVTIAVIDMFDNDDDEILALQEAGDLPRNTEEEPNKVFLHSFLAKGFGFNGDDHGNMVTEIVYDIAPNAAYRLYDVRSVSALIFSIRHAANLDEQNRPRGAPLAQAINLSLVLYSGAPGDGSGSTGPLKGLYDAIRAATENGVILVAATGNSAAGEYWDGDSDASPLRSVYQDFDASRVGSQEVNLIESSYGSLCIPLGDPSVFPDVPKIRAELSWNDWSDGSNVTDADYGLELVYWRDEQVHDYVDARGVPIRQVTEAGWAVAAQSDRAQVGDPLGRDPVERILLTPASGEWATERCSGVASSGDGVGGAIFGLRIKRNTPNPDAPNFLRLFTPDGIKLQYSQSERSLPHPADSPYAVSVAALGAVNSRLMNYSSRGPVLAPGGARPNGQDVDNPKPDLASFTNVATSTTAIAGGTSAAAPHVTGLAALGLQYMKQLSYPWLRLQLTTPLTPALRKYYADATRDALSNVASTQGNDLGSPGFDNGYGAGRLKFHADSGSCFWAAMFAPGHILPTQPENTLPADTYDALHADYLRQCSGSDE